MNNHNPTPANQNEDSNDRPQTKTLDRVANREQHLYSITDSYPVHSISAETTSPSQPSSWLLDLAHQLRNFRQWRFVIKPDYTFDIEYLATLAFQAQTQRKIRPCPPSPQLDLFPALTTNLTTTQDASPVPDRAQLLNISNPNQTSNETPTMNHALALTNTSNLQPSDIPPPPQFTPQFTIVNGLNDKSHNPSAQPLIALPDEVLTILPNEQLHQYLSRVATAAMVAAISTCGSAQAAFIRLGSQDPSVTTTHDNRDLQTMPIAAPRPALMLAPSRQQTPSKRRS